LVARIKTGVELIEAVVELVEVLVKFDVLLVEPRKVELIESNLEGLPLALELLDQRPFTHLLMATARTTLHLAKEAFVQACLFQISSSLSDLSLKVVY
jgi:hypothetical protein